MKNNGFVIAENIKVYTGKSIPLNEIPQDDIEYWAGMDSLQIIDGVLHAWQLLGVCKELPVIDYPPYLTCTKSPE